MHALALDSIVGHELVFLFLTLGGVGNVLKLRELCGDVGEDEKVGVLCVACKLVDTFVGKLYRAVLLVDYEVERVGHHGHFTRVVLEVVRLGLEQDVLHAFLAEEANEGAVLGQTLVCAEEEERTFFLLLLVVGSELGLCFGEDTCHEALLRFHHLLHIGLVVVEELIVALGHWAGDD